MSDKSFKIAAVQASSVFLDKEATFEKACGLIREAAAEGAGLVVFPEAFLPGYPLWVWFIPSGQTHPLRELYTHVDWPVIVLLGAMIPVGQALEISGTTERIATGMVGLSAGLPPAALLALILAVTMTLSDVINNAATAVVMGPIALTVAAQLGVNQDAFLMAVAIGASSAFLTPIGHQNNALILGPGGYRFGDYWRMGLPLEILIIAVAVPLLTIIWPL